MSLVFGLWSLGRTCGAFGLWLRWWFVLGFVYFIIRYSTFDILLVEKVEEVDSLAGFAS